MNASTHLLSDDELGALGADAGLTGASLVLASLDDGRRAAWRADAAITPASMIKVAIALGLAIRADREPGLLDRTVVVDPADVTFTDAPTPFVASAVASLGALACGMIADSDNVATNVLISALDRMAIDADLAAAGLRATAVRRKLSGRVPLIDDPGSLGRNAHPAVDAALAFAEIARRNDPWLLAALRAQRWNEKLSRGWHTGDAFAHKTGDTDEASHDGGILTLPGGARYVVVAYSTLPTGPAADDAHAAFARALRPRLATAPASP